MNTKINKSFDFAKAIEELEEINRWFQNEEIGLDEGLSKFRRGLELIKKSREKLKQVENEFKEIKKEFGEEESPAEESASKEADEEIPF